MIISGGVNIYPQETEDVLITHPAVSDVAVFGVPNEEMGEEVKAVVQPHDMAKAGKELEAELIVFCRKHLSPIKCPKSIDFEAGAAAHADRQAGEAASARQILAEAGGEGVEIVGWAKAQSAVPTIYSPHVMVGTLRFAHPTHADLRIRPEQHLFSSCPGLSRASTSLTVPSRIRRGWLRRSSPLATRGEGREAQTMTTLPDIPLPSTIRSRYVDDINGLRMHVLEAGFETTRPALRAAAARLSRTRLQLAQGDAAFWRRPAIT